MVRTKVFVGNLSFKTTEAELAEEFKASGTVVGANIITRGPRSLGYGFVELESEEDAKNAVKAMNKKEIDGRQINVEVARLREEGEPEEKGNNQNFRGGRPRGSRGGFRGNRGGSRGGSRGGAVSAQSKAFVPRTQGSAAPAPGWITKPKNPTNAPLEQEPLKQMRPPRGSSAPRVSRGGRGGRGGRLPKVSIEQRANTPSKTSLFVANLPFNLDDEGFGKVFSDNGLKFKSAYVVRKRNGHSKGFGFIEFETEEDQQKALSLNNKKIGTPERELIIKIALTETKEPGKEEKKEEPKKEQAKKN